MEYLLDVRWKDPVATAVANVLSALPEGVEQTTASAPLVMSRSFTVLRGEDTIALDKIARAIAAAGADVRIVTKEAA